MHTRSSSYFIPREENNYNNLFKRVRIMPLYSFPHLKGMNCKLIELQNRFFAHMDFDAFYAQIEQRDNLKLRGKPVSVGGTEDAKRNSHDCIIRCSKNSVSIRKCLFLKPSESVPILFLYPLTVQSMKLLP